MPQPGRAACPSKVTTIFLSILLCPARAVTLGLLLVTGPEFLWGQIATTGSVLGTITDPTGAVIPGARVELVDLATWAVRNAMANDLGQYAFPMLAPGSYRLKVDSPGFQAAVLSGVKVEVAKATSMDLKLRLGEMRTTMIVRAESASALQTIDSTVGEVVAAGSLESLPTVTRRAVELAFLQAATMPNTGNANVSRSVAGARGDQNTFILDGMDVSDAQVGGT